ncbi:WecB/TagA/CpsF family glycosyltransferase [Sphingobium sp.]|uniref:WecB/TagA/CpsF family glycosyltransferase n=1 Tax=Sphingobium sp. TaxID=1912891 RepID=UPI002BE88F5C|nr:WecB/TagA/CpsF family glycosyltransferase [Sphingobium sp.]HUD94055.1 WecB/TagA/CpsF family glycosyltransferase [Sphingobium sp.]
MPLALRKELLAWHVARSGRATGTALCVGASLDFLTGEQRRTPEWMQLLSMEWLFRLLTNPRRLWRRYMIEGPAILPIYRHWLAQRHRRRPSMFSGNRFGKYHRGHGCAPLYLVGRCNAGRLF